MMTMSLTYKRQSSHFSAQNPTMASHYLHRVQMFLAGFPSVSGL